MSYEVYYRVYDRVYYYTDPQGATRHFGKPPMNRPSLRKAAQSLGQSSWTLCRSLAPADGYGTGSRSSKTSEVDIRASPEGVAIVLVI